MLKKLFISLILLIIAGVVVWLLIPTRPPIDHVAKIAKIIVPKESKINAFERLGEGREVEYIVSLSLPEGGDKFCEVNKLTATKLAFEPFSPREKGYDLLLGHPGLCYGIRPLRDGAVYIVVRQSEVVIYVDDR
jgi:hypothetical protein